MTESLSTSDLTPSRRRTLDEQHEEFLRSRFLAMPIAGTIAWIGIGVCGLLLPVWQAGLAMFVGTGLIFYLGLGVARFTGEDLLGRTRKGNLFDRIFVLTVLMACLVYAIAIPFYLVEPTSLPLSVGILTGVMWVPFSALIRHWIGLFHGVARTGLIVCVWYLLPAYRFVAIPAVIVALYLVTIFVLARRPKRTVHANTAPEAAV